MSRSKKTFNFTKRSIDTLPIPPAGKRDYYYDYKVQGLELMVTSGGKKSFKVYRRLNASPVRIHVGVYTQITVEEARKKAQQVISEMLKGRNPNDEKRKMRRETNFGEMFELFLERYSKPTKKSWQKDEREVVNGFVASPLASPNKRSKLFMIRSVPRVAFIKQTDF